MIRIFTILLIAGLLISLTVYSQEDKPQEYRTVGFQFTFLFPPLSTNGIYFNNTVNKTSINILLGSSAGTDGFEFGSLINMNRLFMKGAQFGGFINLVGTKNLNYSSTGFQFAGFANITNTDFSGVGIGGFTNIYNGKTSGALFSGFLNYTQESDNSVQFAGFTNIAPKGSTSFQSSGFLNVSSQVNGFQMAGFSNIAKNVKGVQLAGFLNICDSIDGVPIGFINIVKKNGYNRFEVNTSDHAYVQMSFKLGTRHFYNMYSFSKLIEDVNRWSFGGGIGTEIDIDTDYLLNLEFTAHQVLWINDSRVDDLLHIDRLNLLTQFKASLGKILDKRTSVFIAPAFNLSIATQEPYQLGPDFQPYWSVSSLNGNQKTKVRIWPGLSVGMRF